MTKEQPFEILDSAARSLGADTIRFYDATDEDHDQYTRRLLDRDTLMDEIFKHSSRFLDYTIDLSFVEGDGVFI